MNFTDDEFEILETGILTHEDFLIAEIRISEAAIESAQNRIKFLRSKYEEADTLYEKVSAERQKLFS